jgi:DNA replication protein DnaC
MFVTPTDWKSEKWWQNRSEQERLFHIRIPKRTESVGDVNLPSKVQAWVDTFNVGDNLLIHGRPGSGKTSLAATVARSLVRKYPVSARYVEADDYVDMIKESFEHGGVLPEMYSTPHLLKYIKSTFDVLILDGLGQERMTEFTSHVIANLIKRRYSSMKTTIIVSPYNVVDINRRYEQFTASALAEYEVVSL